MEATHLKELKALKDENQRLKQMYRTGGPAELSLGYRLAKEIIEKSFRALSTEGVSGMGSGRKHRCWQGLSGSGYASV
jgi:hypothetical protein